MVPARCPISREVMTTPVLAGDGHTYELAEMQQWITQRQASQMPITSPITNAVLTDLTLQKNHSMKSQISCWRDKRQSIEGRQAVFMSQVSSLTMVASAAELVTGLQKLVLQMPV